MKRISLLLGVGFLVSLGVSGQGTTEDHDAHYSPAPFQATTDDAYTTGEVRRVDKDAQKVTLRHGPIPNLGMPDMTMVFRVTDPMMLDGLKPGDMIRFKADKINGAYTVTALQAARQLPVPQ